MYHHHPLYGTFRRWYEKSDCKKWDTPVRNWFDCANPSILRVRNGFAPKKPWPWHQLKKRWNAWPSVSATLFRASSLSNNDKNGNDFNNGSNSSRLPTTAKDGNGGGDGQQDPLSSIPLVPHPRLHPHRCHRPCHPWTNHGVTRIAKVGPMKLRNNLV